MANRDIFYIVYHTETLKINSTFRWMGKNIVDLLKSDNTLKCLNVTHPKNKTLLEQINKVNNTDYQ